MRHSPASMLGCAFALVAFACSKDRSEVTPPAAVTSQKTVAAAPPSASASDEPERLCGAKSICPDEVFDQESMMLCASLARDPVCGAKFLALVKCQIAKEKCGADGKVDQIATLELCKAEDAALRDCVQAKSAAAQASAK